MSVYQVTTSMITFYTGQYRTIADLFKRSIHEIACTHYTQEQIHAWAPVPIDYEHWRYRCAFKRPFVYLVQEAVAGFIELDHDGHIDCHYVHPDFTRRGIATSLLHHVVDIALKMSLPRLYVEASHLIKPLYLKNGFQCVRANQVVRRGVTLENWIMERTFSAEERVNLS